MRGNNRDDSKGGKRNILKINSRTWIYLSIFFFITLLPITAMLTGLVSTPFDAFSFGSLYLLKNTFILAVLSTAIALLCGVPYAFFVGKTDLPYKKFFLLLSLVPLLIPGYIKAIGWISILGKAGFLSNVLHINLNFFTIWGAAFILGTSYFPIIMFLLIFPLNFLDPGLEEAGLLHFSMNKIIKNITFPLSFNSLLVGILIVLVLSFTNFNVPVLLGINVYSVEIFSYFEAFYDYNYVLLSSLPAMITLLPIFLLIGFYISKVPKMTVFDNYQSFQIKMKSSFLPIIIIIFILSFSIFIPLISLFIKTQGINVFLRTLTLTGKQTMNSLVFAFSGTVIVLIIAFIIASRLIRAENFYYLLIPLMLPGTLMAIGLIKIMNQPYLSLIYNSPIMLILNYVVRFLPIAVVGLIFYIKKINPAMIESASLAKNSFQVIAKIIFPLVKKGVILIGFIVFTLCLGELDSTALLTSPGNETIPLRIFTLMHYGADDVVASLCLIIVLIIISSLFIISMVHKNALNKI
jgi:iron(III) transport system permease protein